MFATWKKNTFFISLMQIILLIVNFFLITIISREYGAEIYGEYALQKPVCFIRHSNSLVFSFSGNKNKC